jgi:hypothetical protein
MGNTLTRIPARWLLVVVASIAAGCSGSGSSKTDAGSDTHAGTGGKTAGTGGAGGSSVDAGAGGADSGGAAGDAGTDTGGGNNPFVYFVKQANGTTTASLAGGTFTVSSVYGTSGNGFKYATPNLYYGTVSNGFIAFPTQMTGDFSISAQITVTAQNKANNASGIGVGITTGFAGTDSYGYILMRNSTAVAPAPVNSVTNGYYVSSATGTSAGAPAVAWDTGMPMALTFSRTGTNLTYAAGPVGGALTSQTTPTSAFTNGTTVYGGGAVYPALSFNNVSATITNLVIKDAAGATVFDSATGAMVTYVPASLTLTATTASLAKGASTTVTATAASIGGALSGVTVSSSDPTVATATVVNGATSSTITLSGLKGGVSTVTVTNTGDANPATNTKTIVVAVAEYPATDPYGSLATLAYPAPGAANAYTDGELALTFDAPPTLNTGGTIRIFKQSDGTEVDSIAFAGETQTFGTAVINVGTQLARVSGNTVLFTPHLGRLAYATGYYVVIPTTSITGTLTTMPFNGLSNLSTVATWKFTTRAAPTLVATGVTVDGAQASAANFRTLQGALGALATLLPATTTNVTITVAAGTYTELVHYTGPGANLTVNIIGPPGNTRGDSCVVQYSNGNSVNATTQTRPSAYFAGANLVLQNITFKNTGVRSTVAQAEAVYFGAGAAFTLAAFNSSFYSNQDTIQTSGRNWFYNCYVEGNVDFIWGTADAALFENCDLRFINDTAGATSYSLFVARTGATIGATASGTVGKGYVLLNSRVSVDANVTAYFGRDAGTGAFYDQAALINVVFSGAGTIGAGLWNVTTAPLILGDASYVGWKSAGVTGLNVAALTTVPMITSAIINSQTTEYDTRDHILNRVVTVTSGAPTGYQAAATTWDVSALATAWGAP